MEVANKDRPVKWRVAMNPDARHPAMSVDLDVRHPRGGCLADKRLPVPVPR